MTWPRLSDLRESHLAASRGSAGRAGIAARSSAIASGAGRPSRHLEPSLTRRHPSASLASGSAGEAAPGTGTSGSRLGNPTAFSTGPLSLPEWGGVAVAAAAAVVRAEPGERLGLRDRAARPPAGLGRVVGHERRRRPADLLEDLAEAVAEALGALGHAGDAEPGVGVRQREDERLGRRPPARQVGLEVAVVDLRGARGPLQPGGPVAGRRAPAPPLGDVAADARVGAGVAPLRDEPVADAPRGVALLPRRAEVARENRVDPGLVALERRARPGGRQRRRGRHVGHVGVPGHRVAAHAELARGLGPGDAPRARLAHVMLRPQGHGHLPFLLPGVVSPKVPP